MDKVSDQKRPIENARVELEQAARSARIEVTLEKRFGDLGGPAAIGLRTLDDLIGYGFEQLRNGLFNFWLPTVSMGKKGKPDAKELEVFERTGAFGLERYQRAAFDRHEEMHALRLVKRRTPEMGEKGFRMAYGEVEGRAGMNKRTDQALTHLTSRWSKEALKRTMAVVDWRDAKAVPRKAITIGPMGAAVICSPDSLSSL